MRSATRAYLAAARRLVPRSQSGPRYRGLRFLPGLRFLLRPRSLRGPGAPWWPAAALLAVVIGSMPTAAAIAGWSQSAAPPTHHQAPHAEPTVAVTSVAPTTVTLAGPEKLVVGGESGLVTVTVLAAGGGPVDDGTAVALNTSLGILSPVTGVTQLGTFTALLTSTERAGLARLTAEAGEKSAHLDVPIEPGPPTSVTISASAATPVVGISVPLQVRLADAFANPVLQGHMVALRASGGRVQPAIAELKDGVARAMLYSEVSGPAVVTATAGAAEASAVVTYKPGPPENLDLLLGTTRIPIEEGETDLSLTVMDRFGNLVDRTVPIDLAAGGGKLSSSRVTTQNGRGSASYEAKAAPGTFQITASNTEGLLDTDLVELRPADLRLDTSLIGPRGELPVSQIHPGEAVTFRLRVSNHDLATAKGVVLAAALPQLLNPEEAVASRPISRRTRPVPGLMDDPPEGHVRMDWELPPIAFGTDLVVDVPGLVSVDAEWTGYDTLYLRGAAASDTAEASPQDLKRGDFHAVHSTDLFVNVDLDWSTSALRPGGQAVYVITLGNNQRQTMVSDIELTVDLPEATSFDHWQPEADLGRFEEASTFTEDSRELVWSFDGAFGLSQGVRLWLDIDPQAPPETLLETVASVTSSVLDIRESNDTRSSVVRLHGVNLTAETEGPDETTAGNEIEYTVAVRNSSPTDGATGVSLSGRPPEGARLLDIDGGQMQGDGTVRWSVGDLAAGGLMSFKLRVKVPDEIQVGTVLQNLVTATGAEVDTFPEDNEAAASTHVVAGPPASVHVAIDHDVLAACNEVGTEVTASVRDALGNPVADGTRVNWSVDGGQLAASSTSTRGGVATNMVTPGASLGVLSVIARAGSAESSAESRIQPGPLRALSVGGFPAIVGAGGEARISVAGLDICSNAVKDGTRVTLQADRGEFVGGNGGPSIEVELNGGSAQASLRVGLVRGPLSVSATANGVLAETMLSVTRPSPTPTPTKANEPAGPIFLPLTLRRG